ncbi:MAG: DUF4381 family protein [Pseudoxanthomonas suwonensis]|nr:DUF4381 family protein [Pseudoxanthomonas suwonensis]
MSAASLPLRDIHLHAAPAWWPPAPGWWLLLAALVLVIVIVGTRWLRRRRHRRTLEALFDRSLATADTPVAQVAAMSELLRRAARRVDVGADRLDAAGWRALLAADSRNVPPLSPEQVAMLVEGGYRPDLPAAQVAALRADVRARFLAWMGAER